MNSYNIFKFDLEDMVNYPSILVIGKRGSGKTFLVHKLLHFLTHKYQNSKLSVVSPTEGMNNFYEKNYPNANISYDLRDQFIQKILTDSSTKISNQIDETNIVVMDNCFVGKKSWTKMGHVRNLIMNGHCYKIPHIVTIDTPIGITRELRLNFDYVFMFSDNSQSNKKKLWNNYASMFPTYSTFESVFNVATKNFNTMVINHRTKSINIENRVFWFKAQLDQSSNQISNDGTIYDVLNNDQFNNQINDRPNDPFDTQNNDPFDTQNNDPIDTQYNDPIDTRYNDPIDTQFNDPIDTQYNDPIDTQNNDPNDTQYNDPFDILLNNQSVDQSNQYTEPNILPENSNLEFSYHDSNYDFSFNTNNLNNYETIKTICNHIYHLKHFHIEHMKLLNENLKLQIELKKINLI